jgi:hypothetical protein
MLQQMHRTRFCSFSYSVTNASNKIHLFKEHATFQFRASFRPQTRTVAAVLPPQSCVHSTVYVSRDYRLIHNVNYNLHSLQLTSQMFVFQYVSLLYYGYRVKRPRRGVDYLTASSAAVKEHTPLPTRLFTPMHVKHIITYLYIQTSS